MTELTKFKRLSELEHIRKRPGIYIGNISNTSGQQWLPIGEKMQLKDVAWNPAILKLFDEAISNSVDEHIRSGKVKTIWVDIYAMSGEISIRDDGGIPVEKHPEYAIFVPEMIFGELRSGSNFDDDDRVTAGVNGLGVKLVNIFSKEFRVVTCDGKKRFTQVFRNGMSERSAPVIQPNDQAGTHVTFTPDYEYFGTDLDEGNIAKLEKRVYDIAGCNPSITVYLNGTKIDIKRFSDYVSMYAESFVNEITNDFDVAVTSSLDDTFTQVSFVNGVDTYNGGTHVNYVAGAIVDKLREMIKKKHKVDVKPNIIRQQLFLIMKCRINAPDFNSQTKEFMCSEVRNFGTSYAPSEKFIKRLFESDVVEKVLNWVNAEKRREELAELNKLNKTTQNTNFLKRIAKFDDATGKDRGKCILVLTEGDSAAKTILSARDPKTIGVFPLRGKFVNVRDIDVKKLAANEEFQNIMSIMGLKIGQKVKSVDELRFGKICLITDADPDGNHICGLIFNMIHEFWPELFALGVISKLSPPLVIARVSKKSYEFMDNASYHAWAETAPKHTKDYYKGLGRYMTEDFKKFLTEPKYTVTITADSADDVEALNIAFDKSKANERKEWLLQ